MISIVKVEGMPRLHTTPLAIVSCKQDGYVVVDLDDELEKRFKIVFQTYQAMRMTTSDCYSPPYCTGLSLKTVMEVLGSDWIEELKATLSRVDEAAKFMNKARHFIVPLQDDFLEVVAWDVTWSTLE